MEGYPYLSLGWLLAKVRKALFSDIATLPLLFKPMVFWIFRFGYLHDIRAINKHVMVELDTSRRLKIPDSFLCRLRPVQARIVLRQLDLMDDFSTTRIGYSKLYYEGLKDIKELIIPPFRGDGSHIYNYFPIQYPDRVKLVKWAMQHRRDFAIQHLKNCASLPGFAPEFRACPNAELTANQTILLPNYPSYGEAEVRKNIAVIRKFFNQGGQP
jgi:dTDP-4-amino-4,6-dideoxygalactose transaminase